jgi:Domain of unknown function (DUF4145)
MASIYCPFCLQHTVVSPAPLVTTPDKFGRQRLSVGARIDGEVPFYEGPLGNWWLGKCNFCQYALLVLGDGQLVHPAPQPAPVSEAIPEVIRNDLREAKQCLAIGAWNAAVVMARRALQCATVEQGAPRGQNLWQQIAWLDDNRKITLDQRRWADVARWVGNDGAHNTEPAIAEGDAVIVGVTQKDAEDTLTLVEHLFETLYVAKRLADGHHARRRS